MELTNEFEVPVSIEQAWDVLTDLPRIAPCLPGAQLTGVEAQEYRGTVKVKVGPIVATYEGAAHFVERDQDARRVVLEASGRDRRQGKASALITATMTAAPGGGTAVALVTDLTVSGKVAQFGRGVLVDVSEKLLGEFVTNLERDVLTATSSPNASDDADRGAVDASTGVDQRDSEPAAEQEVAPVDLLDVAGSSMLKRILPIVGVFVALLAFRRLLRGTRGLPDLPALPDLPHMPGPRDKP